MKIFFEAIIKFILLLLVFILLLSLGSVIINPVVTLKILINSLFGYELFTRTWNKNLEIIIIDIRLFRILFAFLVGAALSLAGDITQKVTKNPLMDPYILGVSSTVVLANIILLIFNIDNILIRVLLSVCMSLFTLAFILIVTKKVGRGTNIIMILVGFSLSTAISSVNSILLYVKTEGTQFKSFIFWSMGNLEIYNYKLLLFVLFVFTLSVLLVNILKKEYELISMGESFASNTGLDYHKYNNYFLMISVVLTSVIVSVCGTIGFIGIIIPNVVKFLNFKNNLFGIILLGGILLVVSDLFSRMILPPLELPVGIVTSLLGGIFFIYYIMVINHD